MGKLPARPALPGERQHASLPTSIADADASESGSEPHAITDATGKASTTSSKYAVWSTATAAAAATATATTTAATATATATAAAAAAEIKF